MTADSTTIVSTGNAVIQVLTGLWPVVASVLTYIFAHRYTSRKNTVKK